VAADDEQLREYAQECVECEYAPREREIEMLNALLFCCCCCCCC
jgi:hypothetical protein